MDLWGGSMTDSPHLLSALAAFDQAMWTEDLRQVDTKLRLRARPHQDLWILEDHRFFSRQRQHIGAIPRHSDSARSDLHTALGPEARRVVQDGTHWALQMIHTTDYVAGPGELWRWNPGTGHISSTRDGRRRGNLLCLAPYPRIKPLAVMLRGKVCPAFDAWLPVAVPASWHALLALRDQARHLRIGDPPP